MPTITANDAMARCLTALLWTTVFLLLLLGIDQLLVQVPASLPAHVAVADFYRDLRGRLIDLAGETLVAQPPTRSKPVPSTPGAAPASVEKVIERHQARPVAPPSATKPKPASQAAEPSPRYVYADDRGELHFADTLAGIPEQFRDKARRLGE